MRDQLFISSIVKSYTVWTWHKEVLDKPRCHEEHMM